MTTQQDTIHDTIDDAIRELCALSQLLKIAGKGNDPVPVEAAGWLGTQLEAMSSSLLDASEELSPSDGEARS